jgi:hypothetical protein
LFRLEDLGGIEALVRWLLVSRTYRDAINALLSMRYLPGQYMQNSLANAVNAAETVHRTKFPEPAISDVEFEPVRKKMLEVVPKPMRDVIGQRLLFANEPSLASRLKDLCSMAAPYSHDIVRSDTWPRIVAGVRNRLTHVTSSGVIKPSGEELYFLAESVYVVLLYCLLREAQASDRAFDRILNAPSTQYLRNRLPEVLERLAPILKRN